MIVVVETQCFASHNKFVCHIETHAMRLYRLNPVHKRPIRSKHLGFFVEIDYMIGLFSYFCFLKRRES